MWQSITRINETNVGRQIRKYPKRRTRNYLEKYMVCDLTDRSSIALHIGLLWTELMKKGKKKPWDSKYAGIFFCLGKKELSFQPYHLNKGKILHIYTSGVKSFCNCSMTITFIAKILQMISMPTRLQAIIASWWTLHVQLWWTYCCWKLTCWTWFNISIAQICHRPKSDIFWALLSTC